MDVALFGASATHLAVVSNSGEGLYEFATGSSALEFLRWAAEQEQSTSPEGYAELLVELDAALDELGLTLEDLRSRPVLLEPPLTPALAVDRNDDLRGTCLVAGRDALWIPAKADPDEARKVSSVWIGQLEPALRLRIYAAARERTPDIFLAFGDAPPTQFLADLTAGEVGGTHFRALHFDGKATRIIGEGSTGRPPTGRLAISRVVSEKRLAFGGLEVFETKRIGSCSNLSAQALTAAGAPYDFSVGLGWTKSEAAVSAEGESVERFFLGRPDQPDLVQAAADGLGRPWLDPRKVAALNPAQRERLGVGIFDPAASDTWWADGLRSDGSPVAAPAALTYMPFPRPPWLHPGFQTTSGTAAHVSFALAAQRAWLELVERDAFLCAWANKNPLRGIRPAWREQVLVEALGRRGLSVRLLSLPGCFGIDVVGAFAIGLEEVLVGAAAGDLRWATGKALMEIVAQLNRGLEVEPIEPNTVRTPRDHAVLWCRADADERVAWLFAEEDEPLDLDPQGPPSFEWRTIEDCPDPTAVFVPIAHPPEAAFTVVRALSTNLVPLSFGYDAEPRAHQRFVNQAWPQDPPWPHPFL
jgi:ribosomal protein S12 methylthiotransferase accessory factor YcaO